jgi:hypothetical protein
MLRGAVERFRCASILLKFPKAEQDAVTITKTRQATRNASVHFDQH